jgi:exodeoxyribonuclease VIII
MMGCDHFEKVGMDINDYHSGPGVSTHGLQCLFNGDPLHYYYEYLYPHRTSKSAALSLGSAFHAYILEPSQFEKQVFIKAEDFNGRTNAGKALVEEQEKIGKRVITFQEGKILEKMKQSVLADSIAAPLLEQCLNREVSMFVRLADGVTLKFRPDGEATGKFLLNLKTTSDNTPSSFNRDAASYYYPFAAANYIDLYRRITGDLVPEYLVSVETTFPYSVRVRMFRPEHLELCLKARDKAVEIYRRCIEKDKAGLFAWGLKEEVEWIDLAGWWLADLERRTNV